MLTPRSATGVLAENGHAGRTAPGPQASPYRVLIYSHDSFGLGHLRRCRAIAHALVEVDVGPQVLDLEEGLTHA